MTTKAGDATYKTMARMLVVQVLEGCWGEDGLLPGEVELADRHRASRSVIREALRIVAAKGLVASRRKAGTRVLPRSRWNVFDPELSELLVEYDRSGKFMRSVVAMRRIVEPAAAVLAAESRTAVHLSRLGAIVERMREGDADGSMLCGQFHATLLTATRNEPLAAMGALVAAGARDAYVKARACGRDGAALELRSSLFAALIERDASAAREASIRLVDLAGVEVGL